MKLTKDETSLLLYLETRAVDHAGRVDQRHMNDEDRKKCEDWADTGFISYGRIIATDCIPTGTHWVHLSTEAYALAALYRRERAERGWERKRYTTTEEKRKG